MPTLRSLDFQIHAGWVRTYGETTYHVPSRLYCHALFYDEAHPEWSDFLIQFPVKGQNAQDVDDAYRAYLQNQAERIAAIEYGHGRPAYHSIEFPA